MTDPSPPTPFDAYSRYYDLLYRDKDYAAEVDYITGLLERYGQHGRELLEFGSGTRRHGRLLAERGYRVTGIERSAEMVAQAQPAPGFSCQQGDICTVQLGCTFDAVLSLFHVVSYQTTNAAVQAVFARAAEHLQPGGLFLFDVWYSPAVAAQRPEVRVKRLAADGMEITRLAEPLLYPNDNRVDVHYTIFARDTDSGAVQTFTETHPMRHFSLPELDLLAASAGFERLCAEAFLTGAP
ncbi:MAG: class I SAM-dependent methyltransferase, partial [Chloroflexia bacterium]|nr:class I SAM-dependent methyltransferase [Chloroflexia bacterium]